VKTPALVLAAVFLHGAAADASAQDAVVTTLGRQVLARPDAPVVAVTSSARASYVLHCSGCHGLDGAGLPASYVPGLKRLGDFLRVPGGRDFVVKVPGVMNSGLDDAQIADMTNWLLATIARDSAPGNQRPYDAAEVARVRAAPLPDVMAERARLQALARQQGLTIH
jgi:mono/diheme cytochrome c family protein